MTNTAARWTRPFERLGRHPARGVVLFALLGFAGSAAVSLAGGIPLPEIHDEFSYLLAGDTFASGRLANPTHPHWEHFETFHVLQRPTYVSKYPPGQGLVLALGQVLFGHPIGGVWLGIGFLCGAMFWMLRAWLPWSWAVLGALLVLIQVGLASEWAQSYWGGAVAATGGALLFGGVRRLVDEPRLSAGVATGVGLGILALSRPLEGLVAALPALGLLAAQLARGKQGVSRGNLLRRGVLPAVGLSIIAVGFFGYYNWRTTGDPTRPAYVEYNRQYGTTSLLGWRDREEPEYRHPRIERFFKTYVSVAADRVRRGFIRTLPRKSLRLALFFLGPAVVALVMLPRVLRDRWMRFALATTLLVSGVVLTTNQAFPHYLAPVAPLVFVLLVGALRELYALLGNPRLVSAIVASMVLVTSVQAIRMIRGDIAPFPRERREVTAFLHEYPGRDLILVDYEEGHEVRHDVHDEFVYNRASIDDADIVWARYMSEREASELSDYFSERESWLLRVGASTTRLLPFRGAREDDIVGPFLLDLFTNLIDGTLTNVTGRS